VEKDRENYCSFFPVRTPHSLWKLGKEEAGDEPWSCPETESGVYTCLQHRHQLAAVCAAEGSDKVRTSFCISLRGTGISCHAN